MPKHAGNQNTQPTTMELVADGDLTMLKITPPQTKDGRVGATKGAYCFVIDVSAA